MNISKSDLQEAAKNLPQSALGCAPIALGTALTRPTRAIYVGTTGNVILLFIDGSTATFSNLPVGLYPFAIVKATTTSGPAADLVALF